MPFQILKVSTGWKIKKPSENKIYKMNFKTKNNAINMAKRWMVYRHESPIVKGNMVVHKK